MSPKAGGSSKNASSIHVDKNLLDIGNATLKLDVNQDFENTLRAQNKLSKRNKLASSKLKFAVGKLGDDDSDRNIYLNE